MSREKARHYLRGRRELCRQHGRVLIRSEYPELPLFSVTCKKCLRMMKDGIQEEMKLE